jgi:hypothetical protein
LEWLRMEILNLSIFKLIHFTSLHLSNSNRQCLKNLWDMRDVDSHHKLWSEVWRSEVTKLASRWNWFPLKPNLFRSSLKVRTAQTDVKI